MPTWRGVKSTSGGGFNMDDRKESILEQERVDSNKVGNDGTTLRRGRWAICLKFCLEPFDSETLMANLLAVNLWLATCNKMDGSSFSRCKMVAS